MKMRFPKSARIHHRSLQERLFNEGSKLHEFPLKVMWNSLTPEELNTNFRNKVPDLIGPVQVLVSVPKKKRRKAVDRVLMRRRIREAFRLNRGSLLETIEEIQKVRTLSVGIIYMKEANVGYAEIEEKMKKLLSKLSERLKEKYMETDSDASEEADPLTADKPETSEDTVENTDTAD